MRWINTFLPKISLLCFIGLINAGIVYADHPTLSLEKGSAGPITTISAVPLEQGRFGFSLQQQVIFNDELSDEELTSHSESEEEIHSTDSLFSTSLAGAYGLSDRLTLGFSLPHVSRQDIREAHHDDEEHDEDSPEGDEEHHDDEEEAVEKLGDSSGMGDLTVYGQYQFLEHSDNGSRAAFLFGIKAPTGSTHEHNAEGERFEAEHQPGSGSWDVLGGLAYSTHLSRAGFDANVLYTFANEGSQNSNLGDVFNYNVALSWRLRGNEKAAHEHARERAHEHGESSWDLILELNGDWREKVNVRGHSDNNAGGNIAYLSAGTRGLWGNGWSFSLSAGVPVVEDLNGIQSEPETRLLLGIRKGY